MMVALAYESLVREARLERGISQEALADQLGVSRQTIVNIENGLNQPRVLLAIALGIALGVAVEKLFKEGTKT
jgi:putative transcriptional regulator